MPHQWRYLNHIVVAATLGAMAGALVLILLLTPGFWTGQPAAWWYPVAFIAVPALFAATVTAITWHARPATYGWILIGALLGFIAAAVVHNLVYGLTGVEEPVFLLLAIWGAPAVLVAGLVGLVRAGVHRLWVRRHPREARPGARA